MRVELVQVTTKDGVRLDGMLQEPAAPSSLGAFCLVHGTGGNFYSSTLFDAVGERLLQLGALVLRVNTRGHDLMCNASTARGGRRLGAAYEIVDDCRHDLVAWLAWLRERAGPRVGLIGHSVGAVKSLYALAHEPSLDAARVVAISPPRLSYGWFCESPEGSAFLDSYRQADELVAQGRPASLVDVKVPLPMAITAAGYVEKYGPDERYNYLRFLAGVRCPVLVTLGSIEAEHNMAFRGAAEALVPLAERYRQLRCATIAGADHFYTRVRGELVAVIEAWLREIVVP